MLGKSRDEFMSKTNQALSDNEATIGQNSSRLGKAESGLEGEMEKLTADGQRIDGIQSELNTMDGMVGFGAAKSKGQCKSINHP